MILLNGEEVVPTIFPDGTSQVWKLDSLKDNHNHVVWFFENEVEYVHILQLRFLIGARNMRWTMSIPYCPYARQDKLVHNEAAFASILISELVMVSSTLEQLDIFDPHSDIVKSTLTLLGLGHKIHYDEPDYSICQNYDVVILPDMGAYQRYAGGIRKYCDNVVHCNKVRDQATGHILSFSIEELDWHPNHDCSILVFDDICDGGKTFEILADTIDKRPADIIDLYVSHGIFSKGFDGLLESYSSIITTDSYIWPVMEDLHTLARQDPHFKQMKELIESGRLIVKELGYAEHA